MKLLLFVAILSFSPLAFTQPQTDSLMNALESASGDLKVKTLNELFRAYNNSDPVKATEYAQFALALAMEIGDQNGIAASYNNLGVSYRNYGAMDNALEYYFKSLRVYESINNKQGTALLKNNIANLYSLKEDYTQALRYIEESNKLLFELGDTSKIIGSLNNLGNLNSELKMYDRAIEHYKSAVELSKKSGNIFSDLLNNIGNMYLNLGNYEMAEKYYKQSFALAQQEGNELMQINVLANLGEVYTNSSQLNLAEAYLDSALTLSDQAIGNVHEPRILKNLAIVYSRQGKIDEAYVAMVRYDVAREKVAGEERSRKNSHAEIALEIQAKEKELREMEKELELQSQKTLSYVYGLIGLLFVMLTGGVTVRFYQLRKINREKQRTNIILETTLNDLKATQSQLIQSEKMASLGELTAGIAHEIQNPLNFVNNFSELNKELIAELKEGLKNGNFEEVDLIAKDIEGNEEKIIHHGRRAENIVKAMLQHSRTSSGQKVLTDINALTDEYLRLAYHGLRAKDKSFNAKFESNFDPSIPKIKIIGQDIGRVILNLINNAFYAVTERKEKGEAGYEPAVLVSTRKLTSKIEIRVKDNGSGVPLVIRDKIFQPFFTTKPTGQGTGLGLSLSYDIVKAHGGELTVETKEGEGSEFVVHLLS